MKTLTPTIKNGKDKLCPYCQSRIHCSNYYLENGKYRGREFWCGSCKSKFIYLKYRSDFYIRQAYYKLPTVSVNADYTRTNYKADNKTPFQARMAEANSFSILPCNRTFSFTSYDYAKTVRVEKELEFPITKDQLEDKISLYITFS